MTAGVFRKKPERPVTVTAVRWFKNGDHPEDYTTARRTFRGDGTTSEYSGAHAKVNGWEGSVVRYFRHPRIDSASQCEMCGRTMHDHGWIDLPGGGHTVCPGDWVVTGPVGERFPLKPLAFATEYEPADAPSTPEPELSCPYLIDDGGHVVQDGNVVAVCATKLEAAVVAIALHRLSSTGRATADFPQWDGERASVKTQQDPNRS